MENMLQILSCGKSVAMTFERGDHVPSDPYSGFSLCHYTGDDPARVRNARKRMVSALGLKEESLVIPRQTHSVNVKIVRTPEIQPEELEDVDALVTDLPGIALCVNTADCMPVVFADGKGRIGIAHAGWRGMVGCIVEKTIEAMISIGADTKDIHVACGPHISFEAFEVGEEVAVQFESGSVIRREEWIRPHISLYASLRNRCLACGISEDNLMPLTESFCSFNSGGRFFSARRLGIASGRTPTIIMNLPSLDPNLDIV